MTLADAKTHRIAELEQQVTALRAELDAILAKLAPLVAEARKLQLEIMQ